MVAWQLKQLKVGAAHGHARTRGHMGWMYVGKLLMYFKLLDDADWVQTCGCMRHSLLHFKGLYYCVRLQQDSTRSTDNTLLRCTCLLAPCHVFAACCPHQLLAELWSARSMVTLFVSLASQLAVDYLLGCEAQHDMLAWSTTHALCITRRACNRMGFDVHGVFNWFSLLSINRHRPERQGDEAMLH